MVLFKCLINGRLDVFVIVGLIAVIKLHSLLLQNDFALVTSGVLRPSLTIPCTPKTLPDRTDVRGSILR